MKDTIANLITWQHIANLATAAVILFVGFYLAKRVSRAVGGRLITDAQQRMLLEKVSYYGIALASIASALGQLGFDLKVILGAAGVLTVAVGFAAQTSASNLISGLFLMVDRPFRVGDFITVDQFSGEVISIDLLSCRMRTINNQLVRIPNETMVKSSITNVSTFPIRRVDIAVGVDYKSDLGLVEATLLRLAHEHPLVLEEPTPQFYCTRFNDSDIGVTLNVWTLTDNVLIVGSEMRIQIKLAFEKAGISIPFPHRVVEMRNA